MIDMASQYWTAVDQATATGVYGYVDQGTGRVE